MGLSTGSLDRRIVILRSTDSDDGLSTTPGEPIEIGTRWAARTDVSDAEQVRAAQQGSQITTRFVVRYDSLTRTITGKDRVSSEGSMYAVVGTKEVLGRRVAIEITANAQPDTAA